jgi:hypothetical protein
MEKSKTADIAAHIVQKRDLGCRVGSLTEVITIEEPASIEGRDYQDFYKLLGDGGEKQVDEDRLGDEHDEEYEAGVIRTNRVFQVEPTKEELNPLLDEGGWGCQPKYSMLKDDRVLKHNTIIMQFHKYRET